MLTWNFRIIKHNLPTDKGDEYFGVHEVYYNKKGDIIAWTKTPCIVGNSFEDIAKEVDHIVNDMQRYPNALKMTKLKKHSKKKAHFH